MILSDSRFSETMKSGSHAQSIRLPLSRLDWGMLVAESGYRTNAVVERSGYSMRTLQRFVRERFDMSLRELVAELRLKRASELLLSGRSVKEVALEVGYRQTSHFVRCFREKFGVTPGVRRESAATGPGKATS
jgi:transcriptional regulator GlxA family with amidase domain